MKKTINTPKQFFLAWLSIWVRPRRTIRQIIDHNPTQAVNLLGALTGIYRLLNQAAKRSWGDTMPIGEILIFAIIIGSVFGNLALSIEAQLFRWIGKKLGGKASAAQVRAAVAWSSVPEATILVLFCPLTIMYGRKYFSSSIDWLTPMIYYLILGMGLLGLLLLIWRSVLTIICLAEVHEFSIWKSLMTAVLSSLAIGIPVILLLIGETWLPKLFPA